MMPHTPSRLVFQLSSGCTIVNVRTSLAWQCNQQAALTHTHSSLDAIRRTLRAGADTSLLPAKAYTQTVMAPCTPKSSPTGVDGTQNRRQPQCPFSRPSTKCQRRHGRAITVTTVKVMMVFIVSQWRTLAPRLPLLWPACSSVSSGSGQRQRFSRQFEGHGRERVAPGVSRWGVLCFCLPRWNHWRLCVRVFVRACVRA